MEEFRESDTLGLTSEEREHLTIPSASDQAFDMRTSLLAFGGLLLIFAFLFAASIIARSDLKADIPRNQNSIDAGRARNIPTGNARTDEVQALAPAQTVIQEPVR